MGLKQKVLGLGVVLVVFLGIVLTIFFTLNYPEIRINVDYLPASCNVVDEYIKHYTCCTQTCFGCMSCSYSDPSCSTLMSEKLPGSCCGGYECCSRCCDTCHSCSGSGKSRSCHSYSCDCHCCHSVSEQACTVSCSTCYNAYVVVKYLAHDDKSHQATIKDSCGTSSSCADKFLSSHPNNATFACWYDPDDYGAVVFHRGYSAWKWVLFALPASVVLAVLCACTQIAFKRLCGSHDKAGVTTLMLWFGLLFPFAFFLPLYAFGRFPSHSGKETLLGFIIAFPAVTLVAGAVACVVLMCRYRTGNRWRARLGIPRPTAVANAYQSLPAAQAAPLASSSSPYTPTTAPAPAPDSVPGAPVTPFSQHTPRYATPTREDSTIQAKRSGGGNVPYGQPTAVAAAAAATATAAAAAPVPHPSAPPEPGVGAERTYGQPTYTGNDPYSSADPYATYPFSSAYDNGKRG